MGNEDPRTTITTETDKTTVETAPKPETTPEPDTTTVETARETTTVESKP